MHFGEITVPEDKYEELPTRLGNCFKFTVVEGEVYLIQKYGNNVLPKTQLLLFSGYGDVVGICTLT